MFQLLYKYLILNKKATVPGIGVFFIERKPAKLDFSNKVFVAPQHQIIFKSEPSLNDNGMYTFISREQKIGEAEAVERYYSFANSLKESLHQQKSAALPGMGTLSQNAEGELFFTAALPLKDYFPVTTAERVLRKNTEHRILVGDLNRTNTQMKEMLVEDLPDSSHKKDYWWVFAIALGIIGIATIVYYYLHNGRLH
jgi:hypothetical protein